TEIITMFIYEALPLLYMLHETWNDNNLRTVKAAHTKAAKYKVSDMLTVGREYTVVNETDEYIYSSVSLTTVYSLPTVSISETLYLAAFVCAAFTVLKLLSFHVS